MGLDGNGLVSVWSGWLVFFDMISGGIESVFIGFDSESSLFFVLGDDFAFFLLF
jgi:hypothetical protein